MRKWFLIVFLLPILSFHVHGKKVVYDDVGTDMTCFFTKENTTYVISHFHEFAYAVEIPKNCTIKFKGGHLQGNIEFDNTLLAGDVNLRGSSVKGSVKNKVINAAWLCAIDGETDDATSINELIEVCGHVFFPSGRYRLISEFNPVGKVPKGCERSIQAHIGIDKSDVFLEGEKGATFVTKEELGTICVFSQPSQIQNSITNVKIKGITFEVQNNGVDFHEYMHTIKVIGVNGLQIKECSFNDFWGDAICLSHYGDTPETGERTRNTNVRICNNIIVGGEHHNNRNGISVVSGKDVLIKENVIKETSRKDMPGAIDVEPNNSAYTIENIQIIGNVIEDCRGTAGGICINTNGKGGPAHHIIIKNNRIKRCRAGLSFVVKSVGVSEDYYIIGNIIDAETVPYQFVGDGKSNNWTFKKNVFERNCNQEIPGKIKVSNLVLKNNKKKDN